MSTRSDPADDWSLPDAQRLIASMPLAVFLITPDGAVAGVNPAAEQLAGQGARRLLGRPFGEIASFGEPRVRNRLGEDDARLFARSSPVRFAGQVERRLDVNLAPVSHSPGWNMVMIYQSSGVEALGGEGAGRAERGTLHAPDVLAHEIKNPLAGIRGAAQLLGRSLGGTDRALTELITAEVDRIARLIDQMQTLGQRRAEPISPCNLHEAIRRAQAVLRASDPAGAPIAEEFDPSLPPVPCASGALVQVLLNLLTNAREACAGRPDPKVVVRTRFASGLQLHGQAGEAPVPLPIELRVSDNGAGVDPALAEHIFEPFVTSKPHGQGLGLALVQKLVREMNGRITHDRDEVTGLTNFRLHLPVVAEQRVVTSGRAAA